MPIGSGEPAKLNFSPLARFCNIRLASALAAAAQNDQ
jgi:hypothetical protein